MGYIESQIIWCCEGNYYKNRLQRGKLRTCVYQIRADDIDWMRVSCVIFVFYRKLNKKYVAEGGIGWIIGIIFGPR